MEEHSDQANEPIQEQPQIIYGQRINDEEEFVGLPEPVESLDQDFRLERSPAVQNQRAQNQMLDHQHSNHSDPAISPAEIEANIEIANNVYDEEIQRNPRLVAHNPKLKCCFYGTIVYCTILILCSIILVYLLVSRNQVEHQYEDENGFNMEAILDAERYAESQLPISEGLTEETFDGHKINGNGLLQLHLKQFTQLALENAKVQDLKDVPYGSNIQMGLNQTFYFSIEENPSTGYMMILDESTLNDILEVESRYEPNYAMYDYMTKPGSQPGEGGIRLFAMRASKLGSGIFRVAYDRPWEYNNWESAQGYKTEFQVQVTLN